MSAADTLAELLAAPTRHLFFTGKGGVGKTSLACTIAIALADRGQRTLLVSTDPASNLDEVLGVALTTTARAIPSVPRLSALNIDPEAAARAYRERIVEPFRGKLPAAALRSIEEQLSGACTVEIAAFDEFAELLGDPAATADFDHVVFDTAPTGHTLRLLSLPGAWDGYLDANPGAGSCLGPLGGLQQQRALYHQAVAALSDAAKTTLVLVARPERSALAEAERTRAELIAIGVRNLRLVVNALFAARDRDDRLARALMARDEAALAGMAPALAALPRTVVPMTANRLVGIAALRSHRDGEEIVEPAATASAVQAAPLRTLVDAIAAPGRGVIMTMGKGGVGKTTVAAAIAVELARRGHPVHLTTTDPAAHVAAAVGEAPPTLRISRIDPAAETLAYQDEVRHASGAHLDDAGRALLEEDLRSPCTEEVAVFRAFARKVELGETGFVVIDTAPTGHTLLLLDAAQTYHREAARIAGAPDAVDQLLPRLRDAAFTKIVIVALPDATPVHEAMRLDGDLRRADIVPFAWILNQCWSAASPRDPLLAARAAHERPYLDEVRRISPRVVVLPWTETPAAL